jgi:hypothetical protein
VKDATPIVFITAQDNLEVQLQAEATSYCVGYFRKTAPGTDVLAAIHHAVSLR